jgi:glutaminyl-peptide cyclotransferase
MPELARCEMNRTLSRLVVLFLLTGFRPFLLAQAPHPASPHRPQEYTFAIVAVYPHDTSAFTQGLAYRDGFLYEGTGREGQSSLRKVRLETGEIVQQVNLEPDLFGEGITLLNDKVIQLTWKSGIGFVYDLNSFRLLRRFSYSGEGWGLATNGRELFLSDGTLGNSGVGW